MDDDLAHIHCHPTSRPAHHRKRSKRQNVIGGVRGGAVRKAKAAIDNPGARAFELGVNPGFAERISATLPYRGPRHWP